MTLLLVLTAAPLSCSFLQSPKSIWLSLTSSYSTPYLRSTFLLFFCLGSIVIYKAIFNILNGSLSSKSQVTSDVPQSPILLPLLLIIYINDIAKLYLLSSTTLTLYADDILISQEISSPTSLSTVQSNINLITLWISICHLTINSQKIHDHLT